MNTLFLSPFSTFALAFRKAEPKVQFTERFDDVERREIVGEMIAAGACESDYGVQMLMSIYPDAF